MKMCRSLRKLRLTLGLFLAIASQQASAIVIELDFSLGGFTASQQDIFFQAESFWESTLTGYQPTVHPILNSLGVHISAQALYLDGAGGVLGQAAPLTGWPTGGYVLTDTAFMQFDSADLAVMEIAGTLESVIVHEMAHALGFGTLWTYNDVYIAGSGQYTGAAGLAAYQAEFDPWATFVPVAEDNGHWNEQPYGGSLTGITDGYGNDMAFELMTPFVNPPTFMSNTSLQTFVDIGYTVANISPVPAPAALPLALLGLGMVGDAYRKRKMAVKAVV